MKNAEIITKKTRIRPAGRHILTIGRDLIKDQAGAILELVKNAYDADATIVDIAVRELAETLEISVSDNGHGMTPETVLSRWMVPSTADKLERRISPGGRVMQGRKGIGRYAVSLLGEQMRLVTTTESGETTRLQIDWADFELKDFLDEIEIAVEVQQTDEPQGTTIVAIAAKERIDEWTEGQQSILSKELRKLLLPMSKEPSEFTIKLKFEVPSVRETLPFLDESETVEPLPILDLYNYRLQGDIDGSGRGILHFECAEDPARSEQIVKQFVLSQGKYCGPVHIDLRVFERETESINRLISRGLARGRMQHLGVRETRNLLRELAGASIYRSGFRIRPYGDAGFDWLELDRQRVQNPTLKIGSDQLVGAVNIASEEESRLEEKSARDGLKDSPEYAGLKEIVQAALALIEERRFIFRRSRARSQKRSLSNTVSELFDLARVQSFIHNEIVSLSNQLETLNTDEVRGKLLAINDRIKNEIERETVQKRDILGEVAGRIQLYEAKVTLGTLMGVVLHEARKPLAFLRNLSKYLQRIEVIGDSELTDIQKRLAAFREQTDVFVSLFEKLGPFGAPQRRRKQFIFRESVIKAVEIFEHRTAELAVSVSVLIPSTFVMGGWPEDITMIFSNLLENSLFWLSGVDHSPRTIEIFFFSDDGAPTVDYKDSGPGIRQEHVESQIIFEPGFSTKPEGTGLGLAIAWEAAERNGLSLRALSDPDGAHFRMSTKSE